MFVFYSRGRQRNSQPSLSRGPKGPDLMGPCVDSRAEPWGSAPKSEGECESTLPAYEAEKEELPGLGVAAGRCCPCDYHRRQQKAGVFHNWHLRELSSSTRALNVILLPFLTAVVLAAVMYWCSPLRLSALFGLLLEGTAAATQKDAAASLLPFRFAPLPLGSVKPRGWMQDQLQLMADGLAGHQHDFYRYVSRSTWLGGADSYALLHEDYPYWFNGIVPLAYALDNQRLKGQIKSSLEFVLGRQQADGWIGPETEMSDRNFWGRVPFFLGLVQLLEADSATYAASVLPAIRRYMVVMNSMLKDGGRGYLVKEGDLLSEEDHTWGQVRVADMLIVIHWLIENSPGDQLDLMTENMQLLLDGRLDWADYYQEGVYIKGNPSELPDEKTRPLFPYLHGVNVAQGLKAGGVINRFTRNDSQIELSRRAVNWTFAYHGTASGTILADERVTSIAPFQGSELCTAVETIYSLAYLYQAMGDQSFADIAEKTAFNAMPTMVSPDWWSRQYVALPNQPFAQAVDQDDNPFWNVGANGVKFGLETNFPCCTVNHPQGYPKFLSNSWAKVGDDGLAHVLLSPSTVTAPLTGGQVSVEVKTNYPFDGELTYTTNSDNAFKLAVRIPSWVLSSSTFSLNNATASPLSPDPATGLHTIDVPASKATIRISLAQQIQLEPRLNDTIAVHAGSLLYAFQPESTSTSTAPEPYNANQPFSDVDIATFPPQARDYSIKNNSPWNIAIDPGTLEFHRRPNEANLQNPIWADGAPPTYITARGCEIEWQLYKGVPGWPLRKADRKCLGPAREVRLVPYGSAKVHMAQLPTVDLSAAG